MRVEHARRHLVISAIAQFQLSLCTVTATGKAALCGNHSIVTGEVTVEGAICGNVTSSLHDSNTTDILNSQKIRNSGDILNVQCGVIRNRNGRRCIG